ncbi:winged helix-turn-helix transcriptional regulator [Bacillus sp. JJ1764]|uniref:winged helix-turn-helix transcriptional regulator n=1 Tax=Bacillus sp. JJ1764 TaxID=3122964 RepID=UPI003000635A
MNEIYNCQNNDNKKEIPHFCTNFLNSIEFIGKRWTGIIIYTLLRGPKRYNEIISEIHGISDRLLTERLRDLEKEGLIVKKMINQSPKKVEYELTEAGKQLEEVIEALMKWVKSRKNI